MAAPDVINTDMNTSENGMLAAYFTPISRSGGPSDVASVVYFLASDEGGDLLAVKILRLLGGTAMSVFF